MTYTETIISFSHANPLSDSDKTRFVQVSQIVGREAGLCNFQTLPFGDLLNFLIILSETDKQWNSSNVVAISSLSIFSRSTLDRPTSWEFGNNRDRSAWIEFLSVRPSHQKKGLGSRLLTIMEELSREHIGMVSRKNIYVSSTVDATGFYYKNGYDEIEIGESDEDEDYPQVHRSESGVIFYAKPLLGDKLDGEILGYSPISDFSYLLDALWKDRTQLVEYLNTELLEETMDWVENAKDKARALVDLRSKPISRVGEQVVAKIEDLFLQMDN